MYNHTLDPILIDLGFLSIRWYSLAYILGVLMGWYLGRKIITHLLQNNSLNININQFDDFISYLIISIILGGRIGYILFYNLHYYILNPLDIFKIWEGGMSFHGALLGIVVGSYIFSIKNKIKIFVLLDIVACVSPVGIFLGRLANFVNGELYGKPTNQKWGVIFSKVDSVLRHPSQLYEAFLEGIIIFIILNLIIFKSKYKPGICSSIFLITYGTFRVLVEQYRVPDPQIGLLLEYISMGSLLSLIMIVLGMVIFFYSKKK